MGIPAVAMPGTELFCPTIYFDHMDDSGRPSELGDAGGPSRTARASSIGRPLDRWMHPGQSHWPIDAVLTPLNNLGRRLGTINDCEVNINYWTGFPSAVCTFAGTAYLRRLVRRCIITDASLILLSGGFSSAGAASAATVDRRPVAGDSPEFADT